MGKVYRILDANLNRAAEGLRTAEEYARLVLGDSKTRGLLQSCRADVKAISDALGIVALEDRDIAGDIGTDESASSSRSSAADVARAAIHRAQEALRVIEEYGHLVDAAFSGLAARIRYRAYDAEQQMLVNGPRRAVLEESPVMVVCDSLGGRDNWQATVKALIDAGARLFQLREKTASAAEFLKHAQELIALVGDSGIVIINDRADIAVAVRAQALHIGQDDLPIEEARGVVGPATMIGTSTHNRAEAELAVQQGCDYIGAGAMFDTSTKDVQSTLGPKLLSEILPAVDIPVFAIGGINTENVSELAELGCKHVAVSGAILDAPDPVKVFKTLEEALVE